MSCPLMQYQAYNHLALRPVVLGLGEYKPDIALLALHNIYIYTHTHTKPFLTDTLEL